MGIILDYMMVMMMQIQYVSMHSEDFKEPREETVQPPIWYGLYSTVNSFDNTFFTVLSMNFDQKILDVVNESLSASVCVENSRREDDKD
ncbi:unnamed protein product [Anisakis simplex]|uniref:Transmembrane protein n=1 Tax=Anisakis simplex TaxID=6269 RepID=A0A0M3KAK0_ANISI|nr:unnamed protein product [Anisakis simplex]